MKLHWTKAVRRVLALAVAALLAAVPAMAAEDFRSAQAISNFSEGLAAFQDASGLWGYLNRQGEVVIEPAWDYAGDFCEGRARVRGDNQQYGYIDAEGNVAVAPLFTASTDFDNGVACVQWDGAYSYIDEDGVGILDGKWADAGNFSEGLAYAKIDGSYGYIDESGQTAIAPRWDRGRSFSEGYAAVRAGDLWGFIDKSGSVVVEPQDDAVRFKDSLAAVEKDELKGYIDASGNVVIPLQYEVAGAFEQGRAWAKLDGEYRMIDKTGAEIGANRWDNVFSEFAFTDLCRVCRGGLWGYVNLNDEIVLNPVYEKATRLSDGLAAVKKDGVWYFIDEKGADVLSGENTQA